MFLFLVDFFENHYEHMIIAERKIKISIDDKFFEFSSDYPLSRIGRKIYVVMTNDSGFNELIKGASHQSNTDILIVDAYETHIKYKDITIIVYH